MWPRLRNPSHSRRGPLTVGLISTNDQFEMIREKITISVCLGGMSISLQLSLEKLCHHENKISPFELLEKRDLCLGRMSVDHLKKPMKLFLFSFPLFVFCSLLILIMGLGCNQTRDHLYFKSRSLLLIYMLKDMGSINMSIRLLGWITYYCWWSGPLI